MMKERRKKALALFLKDRLLNILLFIIVVGLACGLYLLENARYPGLIETETIYYFILLTCFLYAVWLLIDYIRQRYYFDQMYEALERSDDIGAATIIQAMATEEQRLAAQVIHDQHRTYLNELNRLRRQQELHNHFVLQWVHHMKTPVSVIDLQLQESRRQPPAGEAEWLQLMDSIKEETERLTNGLEMMLHTARLDKFEMDVHLAKTPLHELVRSVVNTHKRLCIRYSIFPRVEGEAFVETDGKWMSFVLSQLVSNAIKYSRGKPGSKTLLFRIYAIEDGAVKLEVADSGIGIAQHDLPRIFDPFFTGENGRATGDSTGMGLYLAKQVCNRLGHILGVQSELGEGTTFSITFRPRGIHVMESGHG